MANFEGCVLIRQDRTIRDVLWVRRGPSALEGKFIEIREGANEAER